MKLPGTLDLRRRARGRRDGDWVEVDPDEAELDDGWEYEYVWVDEDPDEPTAGADEPEVDAADGDGPPDVDPRIAARRQGVDQERRGRRRRRLVVLAVVVAVVALAIGVTRSPLLDVDTVTVTGASQADAAALVAASGIGPGDPLVGLDLDAARAGVAADPWVRDVTVARTWSGDVTIAVAERTPVATVNAGEGGWLLVDGERRVVARTTDPPALPIVDGVGTAAVGADLDPTAQAALDVAAALTPGLRTRVAVVHGADPAAIELTLTPTGTVRFGPATEVDTRIGTLQTVFARVDLRCLATVDVRVPDQAVLTRVPACA